MSENFYFIWPYLYVFREFKQKYQIYFFFHHKIKIFLLIFRSDREALQELDAKLKEERKQSGEMVCANLLYIFLLYRILEWAVFLILNGLLWPWSYCSWTYQCDQCLITTKLWVWFLSMARCTQYNIKWYGLSVCLKKNRW